MLAEPRVFTGVAWMIEKREQGWLKPAAPPGPIAVTGEITPAAFGLRDYEASLLNPLRGIVSMVDSLLQSGEVGPELVRQVLAFAVPGLTKTVSEVVAEIRWLVQLKNGFKKIFHVPTPIGDLLGKLPLDASVLADVQKSVHPHLYALLGGLTEDVDVDTWSALLHHGADAGAWISEALAGALAGEEGLEVVRSPKVEPAPGLTVTPDLAAWPRGVPRGTVPVWCAEILSPARAATVRRHTLRVHAQLGVRHIWLIDPATALIEVYRARRGRITLVETVPFGEPHRLPPFTARLVLRPPP